MRDRYPQEASPSGLLRIDDTNNRFTQVQRELRAQLLSRICHIHCHLPLCVPFHDIQPTFPFLDLHPPGGSLLPDLLGWVVGEAVGSGVPRARLSEVTKDRNLESLSLRSLRYDLRKVGL